MNLATMQLMRLVSPALPIGSFAYSQAMENAVDSGWIHDEPSAASWIGGILRFSVATLDLPLLVRMHRAWSQADSEEVHRLSAWLLANRETRELRLEDRMTGGALARLLAELGNSRAAQWRDERDMTLAAMFSLAAVSWKIGLEDAAAGYLWAWLENQAAAAIKLVPLGHTAAQRVIENQLTTSVSLTKHAMEMEWEDIGGSLPAVALASARHETQRSRLFRS